MADKVVSAIRAKMKARKLNKDDESKLNNTYPPGEEEQDRAAEAMGETHEGDITGNEIGDEDQEKARKEARMKRVMRK